MKPIQMVIRFFTVIALAVWAVGCASHLQDKINVALAADFKVITPSKPDQQAILQNLRADKVTLIDYQGKPFYVLPDLKNNRAYVGGPKQYEEYQRLRRAQLQNSENIESMPNDKGQNKSQIHQVNWSDWGGWGGWGPYGWY